MLLRPVVQDTLLATAAYVAGPAEVAYFAQASVVYQRLLGRMPVILPRASFTLVDAHAVRLLRKYGLEFPILEGPQALRKKMERDFSRKRSRGSLKRAKKNYARCWRICASRLPTLDPTLSGSLDTAEGKMLYQFTNLQGKVGTCARVSLVGAGRALERVTGAAVSERGNCRTLAVPAADAGIVRSQLLDELTRRISPAEPSTRFFILKLARICLTGGDQRSLSLLLLDVPC